MGQRSLARRDLDACEAREPGCVALRLLDREVDEGKRALTEMLADATTELRMNPPARVRLRALLGRGADAELAYQASAGLPSYGTQLFDAGAGGWFDRTDTVYLGALIASAKGDRARARDGVEELLRLGHDGALLPLFVTVAATDRAELAASISDRDATIAAAMDAVASGMDDADYWDRHFLYAPLRGDARWRAVVEDARRRGDAAWADAVRSGAAPSE
jgi:hypothetical protein